MSTVIITLDMHVLVPHISTLGAKFSLKLKQGRLNIYFRSNKAFRFRKGTSGQFLGSDEAAVHDNNTITSGPNK